jgi:hypothetical protein
MPMPRLMPMLAYALLLACGSASTAQDRASDAGRDSPLSGDAASDAPGAQDAVTTDAQASGDGGKLAVACSSESPYLVVTKPSAGSGPSTTLLRLPLFFSAKATGITLTSVTQHAADTAMTTLRTWKVSSLAPPSGFDGTFDPVTLPAYLLYLASDTALESETQACTQAPWQRPMGTIHVTGSTHEGGNFAFDCPYGFDGDLVSAEPLGLSCATGIPGWLGGDGSLTPSIMGVTSPVEALLVSTGVQAVDLGPAPATGFTATGVTITAYDDPSLIMPGLMCPTTSPTPWTLSGGTLWAGGSSMDVWSGPAAPNVQTNANWFYSQNGAQPEAGFCVPPSTSPMSCPPPADQIVLRGSSSAGPFQWESGLFACITTM